MNKKIVIMMSTYNGEKYIEKQLESIFGQKTDCDVNLYVRDDKSKDSTLDILSSWEDKIDIKYIKDDNNLGAARSFWKLLKEVPEADYYAFSDQDDFWDADKLQKAVKAIGDTKEEVLWCSNCRIINSEGNVMDEKKHKVKPNLFIPSQIVCGSMQGCAMVFNSSLRNRVLKINDKNILMHDIIIMLYALADGKVLYEECPCFSYRVHENNVVAKEGKSFIKSVKSTIDRWFGKKNKYEVSNLAKKIIMDKEIRLSKEDREYLYNVARCRKSLKSRIWIINNKNTDSTNKKAVRSFKIRVLLGIV